MFFIYPAKPARIDTDLQPNSSKNNIRYAYLYPWPHSCQHFALPKVYVSTFEIMFPHMSRSFIFSGIQYCNFDWLTDWTWSINSLSRLWLKLKSLDVSRCWVGCVIHNGEQIAVGGWNNASVTYLLFDDRWVAWSTSTWLSDIDGVGDDILWTSSKHKNDQSIMIW